MKLGIKQQALVNIAKEQGFITAKDLNKTYSVHSIGMAGIHTLELMNIVIWNKEKLRWDLCDNHEAIFEQS